MCSALSGVVNKVLSEADMAAIQTIPAQGAGGAIQTRMHAQLRPSGAAPAVRFT
jgi:hypothetical protein